MVKKRLDKNQDISSTETFDWNSPNNQILPEIIKEQFKIEKNQLSK